MAQTTRDEKAGENVAELGKRTTDRTADATLEAAERAEDTAGRGLQAAQGTADATLETAERAGENVAELGRRTAGKAADATLEAAEKAEDTAGAAVEVERAVARRSAEGTAELGQAFADLLDEQTRHGVEAFRALTRTVDWDQAARIQGEFLRVSLERTAEFNRRYFEVVQAVISSAAATAKDQARKAA